MAENDKPNTSAGTYLEPQEAALLRQRLLDSGYRVTGAEDSFSAVGQDVNATYYKTGTLLVQGKATQLFLDQFVKELVGARYDAPVIGSDEAGKGDYFGPLVVAAVCVDRWSAEALLDAGVQDSKKLSDDAIMRVEPEIIACCQTSVVAISPERYNELHARMHNLNKLLAWAHARAIENVLEQRDCAAAVTDQFGKPELVEKALMEKGRKLKLVQKPRAEQELPVAAASILARAEFLKRLKALEKKYGLHLPKGASEVEDAGREFVRTHGENKLPLVAKWHFKTTKKILAGKQLEFGQ
jgi:ribonuclease HIII